MRGRTDSNKGDAKGASAGEDVQATDLKNGLSTVGSVLTSSARRCSGRDIAEGRFVALGDSPRGSAGGGDAPRALAFAEMRVEESRLGRRETIEP
jgi:hypothetical protein